MQFHEKKLTYLISQVFLPGLFLKSVLVALCVEFIEKHVRQEMKEHNTMQRQRIYNTSIILS